PILTYNNQGVAKRGAKKSDHAIIYTGQPAPSPSPQELPQRGESPMRPKAIRVTPDNETDKLSSEARVNFGKIYTIEQNVRVRPFGKVHRDSIQALVYQFNEVWSSSTSSERSATTRPSSTPPAVVKHSPSSAGSEVNPTPSSQHMLAYAALKSQGWASADALAVLRRRGDDLQKSEGTGELAGNAEESDEEGEDGDNDDESDSD
ncbi:hypothetical protein LTR36_003903, partial [Oleoguttula mirabilis]